MIKKYQKKLNSNKKIQKNHKTRFEQQKQTACNLQNDKFCFTEKFFQNPEKSFYLLNE